MAACKDKDRAVWKVCWGAGNWTQSPLLAETHHVGARIITETFDTHLQTTAGKKKLSLDMPLNRLASMT